MNPENSDNPSNEDLHLLKCTKINKNKKTLDYSNKFSPYKHFQNIYPRISTNLKTEKTTVNESVSTKQNSNLIELIRKNVKGVWNNEKKRSLQK